MGNVKPNPSFRGVRESEFPIEWCPDGDEGKTWIQDSLHNPFPVTPLDFSFLEWIDGGIQDAARGFGLPVAVHDRHFNGYLYICTEISETSDPGRPWDNQEVEAKVHALSDSLETRWEIDWLPEINQHLDILESFPLADTSRAGLLDHLEGLEDKFKRIWRIHFDLYIPILSSIKRFQDLFDDLFGPGGPLIGLELLAGFENRTLQNDLEQWKLSELARNLPLVKEAFARESLASIAESLGQHQQGRQFLDRFANYLTCYGKQNDRLSICSSFWVEDPLPVWGNIKALMTTPHEGPAISQSRLVARREELIKNYRGRLEQYPVAIRNAFDHTLASAQDAMRLREDHSYPLDKRSLFVARQTVLELGRRLSLEGFIDQPEDVFYLYVNELRDCLRSARAGSVIDLIGKRKEQQRWFSAIVPPLIVGTVPEDESPMDLLSIVMQQVEGDEPMGQPSPGIWRGTPGSPGCVRGKVRVIEGLKDAAKLAPDDILVTRTTSPSWTSLFGRIGGLVTDTGGVLCHGAGVAREYGIPAVVGTKTTSTSLTDGQEIEVDGDKGEVRLIESK